MDDHPVVRYGIRRILCSDRTLTVVGEAADETEALQKIEKTEPDVALVDISLRNGDGLCLTKMLHSRYPDLYVLILSMHSERFYGCRALKCGARGYLTKEESSLNLAKAVKCVLSGKVWINDDLNCRILNRLAGDGNRTIEQVVDILSNRERQIFTLIGSGNNTKTIARKLSLSVKTIESHRARIKQKLNLATSSELVATAADWLRADTRQPVLTS